MSSLVREFRNEAKDMPIMDPVNITDLLSIILRIILIYKKIYLTILSNINRSNLRKVLVYRASHWLRSVNNLRSPRSDDGAFFDSEDEIGKTW